MYLLNKRASLSVCALACALLFINSNAVAFPDRIGHVPNNQWNCALCHVSPGGGGERTSFGEETRNAGLVEGRVDWTTVCEIDSDGDSFTNGQELGDPTCSWVFGDPNPAGEITNPADAASVPSQQMMEEAGEMMEEAGEMMEEAGEMMMEAGEMMMEAGEMMVVAGEMANEDVSGGSSGGCDSKASKKPWSVVLSILMLLGLMRLGRRYS